MLKVGPKLFAIAISLCVMSFSHSTIAAICGPGDHWVDTCPSGIDEPILHWIEMTLNLEGMGQIDMKLDGGDFKVYRGEPEDGPVTITPAPIPTQPPIPSEYSPETFGTADSHHDVIRTELVSMVFEGETPLGHVTIQAGDGNGNLENDDPLYSPGIIYESPTNPAEACSIFWITFIMKIAGIPDGLVSQAIVMYCFLAPQGLGGWGHYRKLSNGEFGYFLYNMLGEKIGEIMTAVHPVLN